MFTRRTSSIVGIAAVALVVFACWLIGGWGGPDVIAAVSTLGSLGFTIFAFGCTATVARLRRGRQRLSWGALAVALCGWIAGNLIWTYYTLILHSPPPNSLTVNFVYLLLPLGLCITWAVSAPGGGLARLRPVLDGLIVAAALFLILWVVALKDLFQVNRSGDLQLALAVAHPIADLVMITMALVVMTNAARPYQITIGLLTAGLFAIAAADTTVVYLNVHGAHNGNVVNLPVIYWASGLVLIGTSALRSLRNPQINAAVTAPAGRMIFWLPYVPLPFAIAIGIVTLWPVPHAAPVLLTAAILVGAALARQFVVLVDNRRLLETVAEQALRDPLTGLGNRLLFSDRLSHAVQLRQRDGREVAVLSLDLDDFKLVNDNLGHLCGDVLLKEVADRLVSCVPTWDTVARLGGDEFAILVEDGAQPAPEVAQRVVEVFDKPFFLDGEEVYIHPSVGLAIANSPEDEVVSAEELFKRADLAMYTAKRAGTGGVQEFTGDMRHVDLTERRVTWSDNGKRRRAPIAGIQLLGQLRRAIDERRLVLVYQPKISLSTGGIVGVEALVRWPHPEQGLLTPPQFLPLVRQNGLMGAVSDLVLTTAINDAATWYDADTCNVPVAVNLFAPAWNDLTLPDRMTAALAQAGVPSAALSLEITEHLLLANIRRASMVIAQLRANGINIAIDDFGSGYATMSYLRDLPIDELKLDRQFIAPILSSERAAAIVQSVIDLAHALGIRCVAEGVEDAATADRLRKCGCDVAQGHFFDHPMPADALRDRLRTPSTTRPSSA